MAKITPPEVTQEFHFYTMKKFPKVLDNKIHVVHFLEATTDLLVLIDQLGNMFAPVKYDMQGNVDKIKKFYTYKEDTCLLALMLDEKSRGRDEGAEGVLWLNRSLLFFELVFEEIIKSLQRKEIDASIKTILTTAYNGSVKKYHNWVTQKLFSMTKCKSGSGGDYIPTAYWFPLLRFLDISTEADASQSNLDSQSPQADSDSVDTQQAREEEIEHPHKTKKKKKKKLGPAEAGDADGLIKEATATMRQMSQHITSNAHTNSDSHITSFCNFVNSELTSILHASNNNFVKKAKRNIQMCLFDIWDEIDTGYMHEERPSTQYTNYSENSIISQNTRTSKSVVTGNACSIVIKRNDLLTYNSPQENDSVEICTEDEDNIQKSNEKIVYYINNYDPEDMA